jgi:hypothetical protein
MDIYVCVLLRHFPLDFLFHNQSDAHYLIYILFSFQHENREGNDSHKDNHKAHKHQRRGKQYSRLICGSTCCMLPVFFFFFCMLPFFKVNKLMSFSSFLVIQLVIFLPDLTLLFSLVQRLQNGRLFYSSTELFVKTRFQSRSKISP